MQKAYYEEGRITIDRFIDGLTCLEKGGAARRQNRHGTAEIRKRHVNILEQIANREDAEIQVGRGTIADLSEARQRHLEAEYETKIVDKEAAEKAAILRRLSELERIVDAIQKGRTEKPAGNR